MAGLGLGLDHIVIIQKTNSLRLPLCPSSLAAMLLDLA